MQGEGSSTVKTRDALLPHDLADDQVMISFFLLNDAQARCAAGGSILLAWPHAPGSCFVKRQSLVRGWQGIKTRLKSLYEQRSAEEDADKAECS